MNERKKVSELPRNAKLVDVRERIITENCNVDNVDANERGKVLDICREVLNMAEGVPSLTIYCTDGPHKTIASVMGWSRRFSLPDFITSLFDPNVRKDVFSPLMDLICDLTTGEMELHIKKTNAVSMSELDRARKHYSTATRKSRDNRRPMLGFRDQAPRRHVEDDDDLLQVDDRDTVAHASSMLKNQRRLALDSRSNDGSTPRSRTRRPFIPNVGDRK